MAAGLASVLLPTQTVFTIALAVAFLGERPGTAQLAGATVAVAGVVVIAAGRARGVPLGPLLMCLGAAASWGVGNICSRRAQAPDALALLVWSSLVPPLPLLVVSLVFEGPARIGGALGGIDAAGLLALLYVVVVSTGFGFGTWTWLLGHHPASRVAPFTLLVPPVGIAAAWIALGQQPSLSEAAGAAVILAGLALITVPVRVAWPLLRRRAPMLAAGVVRSTDGD
jgi:O-acetylserine/cysteine efflux transporter